MVEIAHPWLLERPWPTAKLPREQLEEKIEQFLASQNLGVLATDGPKGIIATPIEYYADRFSLYFVLQPGSPKLTNVQANPRVSFALANSLAGWASARGCQLFGSITLLPPGTEDWERGIAIYRWQGGAAELGRDTVTSPQIPLARLDPDRITWTEHWLRKSGYAPRQTWRR